MLWMRLGARKRPAACQPSACAGCETTDDRSGCVLTGRPGAAGESTRIAHRAM